MRCYADARVTVPSARHPLLRFCRGYESAALARFYVALSRKVTFRSPGVWSLQNLLSLIHHCTVVHVVFKGKIYVYVYR